VLALARELDLDIARGQRILRPVLLSSIGLRVATTSFFFIIGLGYDDPLGVASIVWLMFGVTMLGLGLLSVLRGPFRLTARIDALNEALREMDTGRESQDGGGGGGGKRGREQDVAQVSRLSGVQWLTDAPQRIVVPPENDSL